MRRMSRRVTVVLLASLLVVVSAGVAFAATITSPTGSPFVVPSDGNGNPVAFTVVASGFSPGQLVFIDQCDGVAPTAPGWSAVGNCDISQTTAAAIANASGVATFSASDPNHTFVPFKGESPSSLFNCLSPNDPPLNPENDLTDFRNCKIKVSSNNNASTGDQTFLNIQLPDTPAATTTTTSTTSTTSTSTTTSTTSTTTTVPATTTTTTVPDGGGTTAGSCAGGQLIAKAVGTDPANPGLTDQTHRVTLSAGLATDLATKGKIAGTCTGLVVPADNAGGAAPATLHPKAIALKLSGIGSCASTPAARTADGSKAQAFALTGKATITMTELDSLGKSFQVQAYVTSKGFAPGTTDVLELSGVVVKGPDLGATVSGKLYLDPVTKITPAPKIKTGNGYAFDSTNLTHCGDATANNTTVALAQMGDGTSLANTAGATGLTFSYPAATAAATTPACSGGQLLAKATGTDPANLGLTDQSHRVTLSAGLLANLATKAKIGGTCSGLIEPADNAGGGVPATLHPKTISLKVSGIGSCASTTAAKTADAASASGFALSGKVSITMTELDSLGKAFQVQAYVTVKGYTPGTTDQLDFTGLVIKGPDLGATVSGKLYLDPVTKITPTPHSGNGYTFDSTGLAHCGDATANNASVALAQMGDGTSLANVTGASGLSFSYPSAS